MDHKPISLKDIEEARAAISSVVHETATDLSQSCSQRADAQIYLKLENLQKTGSFKIRGALNKVKSLTAEEKARGVVASSAGNHAQGVAFSCSNVGVPATIVMPTTASLVKVAATKAYGAKVVQYGDYYDQAYEHAQELAAKTGATFVHPYEDAKVVAGQGTIGLEILKMLPDLDSIVVPIGGGGLMGGIATAVKAINPKCRVYGVQSLAAPSLVESFRQKKLVKIDLKLSTIADGLAVKTPSETMYRNYISRLVDDVATVSEDEIAEAILFLMERAKTIVEGSGAIGLGAVFAKKFDLGKKCAVVLCGGNIDMNIVSKVIERGMRRSGRLGQLTVAVEDKPGTLSRLANILAQKRANILQVHHERGSEGLFLGETAISFTIETSSWDHFESIKSDLIANGCRAI